LSIEKTHLASYRDGATMAAAVTGSEELWRAAETKMRELGAAFLRNSRSSCGT
jgi:hypothetical protein